MLNVFHKRTCIWCTIPIHLLQGYYIEVSEYESSIIVDLRVYKETCIREYVNINVMCVFTCIMHIFCNAPGPEAYYAIQDSFRICISIISNKLINTFLCVPPGLL